MVLASTEYLWSSPTAQKNMHLLCYSESAKISFVISEVEHQMEDQSCVMHYRLQVDSSHAKCVLLNEDCSFETLLQSLWHEKKMLPQAL